MGHALPRHVDVELEWHGSDRAALSSRGRAPIWGATPSTMSDPLAWDAEDLLLSSISLCLMTAFQTLADKAALKVHRYHCRTEATLGATRAGLGMRPGFTFVTVHVDVDVDPEQVERARDLMVQAKQHCVVANTLMPPVHLELAIHAVEGEPECAGACR